MKFKQYIKEGMFSKRMFEVNVEIPMLGKNLTYAYKVDPTALPGGGGANVGEIIRNVPKGLKIKRRQANVVWLTGDAQAHHAFVKKLQNMELSGEVMNEMSGKQFITLQNMVAIVRKPEELDNTLDIINKAEKQKMILPIQAKRLRKELDYIRSNM